MCFLIYGSATPSCCRRTTIAIIAIAPLKIQFNGSGAPTLSTSQNPRIARTTITTIVSKSSIILYPLCGTRRENRTRLVARMKGYRSQTDWHVGGDAGIRTLGSFTSARFLGECHRPLDHISMFIYIKKMKDLLYNEFLRLPNKSNSYLE